MEIITLGCRPYHFIPVLGGSLLFLDRNPQVRVVQILSFGQKIESGIVVGAVCP